MRVGFALSLLVLAQSAAAGDRSQPYYPQGWVRTEPCLRTEECRKEGRCKTLGDECVAASDRECRFAAVCRDFGQCSYDAKAHACVGSSHVADPGMMATGFVFIGFGGVAVLAGAFTLAVGGLRSSLCIFHCDDESATTTAGGILIGGGAAVILGVGVPLVILGGPRMPPRDVLRVELRPGGVALAGSF